MGEKSKKTDSKSVKTAKPEKVKAKQSDTEGLRNLFINSLKDIYWVEKAMAKALPKLAENATNTNLISSIYDHLEETEKQSTRLEDVFANIGQRAVAKKCEAMEGLIKESENILEETEPGAVRDASIIAALQKMEHYEIASYGTLVAFAATLGENEASEMLEQTLNEEKEAGIALTEIAYKAIHFDATQNYEVYTNSL